MRGLRDSARPVFALLLLLGGCARGNHHDIVGIDSTFQPYYDSFGATYGIYVGVPIGFMTLAAPMDGQCRTYNDGYRQIAIDPTYWQSASEADRKNVIWHELGHCLFNRLHNRLTLSDGCPKSIMNPYTFGDPCMTRHFAEYVQELPYAEAGDYL